MTFVPAMDRLGGRQNNVRHVLVDRSSIHLTLAWEPIYDARTPFRDRTRAQILRSD